MKQLFDTSSYSCSRLVTKTYSTSFSKAITLLAPSVRPAIYAIYGFVRYADEIVDSFHSYNQEELLKEFEQNYYKALERKISLNPILNAFQEIVHSYKLYDLVDSFMHSMKMDLHKNSYQSVEEYKDYIYGSADVVGLMCLKVFVRGNEKRYTELEPYARRLGSAFQKVNFLRDFKDDTETLGRSYFPNLQSYNLDDSVKREIIKDIEDDFAEAYKGIVKLPIEGRLGVYLAYRYYMRLLRELKLADSKKILKERIRVNNFLKLEILLKSYVRYKLNIL
ncbi:phytoene/squalene synthase family protein [Carboxylicivirga linearis]|uniref:Phytoene/squalene synthase family protein n=1 Tax=Carboxylicivirga linearis TaxID=1628157 RepID=A0ABS5JQ19_9BACT|nr:phytoene/squalene synthase family protein [Carboxylicivirga linearis]MBS2096917.1 phytoene/squalene synthase family protein [Carboxylicivirga linearis]